MHLLRNLSRILLDGLHALLRDMHGRNDAGRIAGMNPGKLDMLHHSGHKSVGTVADGIRLALQRVI